MLNTMLIPLALAGTSDGRLSNPAQPTAQTVRLNLDPQRAQVEGLVEIVVQVNTKVDHLTLHAEDLEIAWVTTGRNRQKPAEFTLDGPFLTITPPKPFKPGTTTLEIGFSGTVGTDAAGLYKTIEHENTYLVTQFEADDARTAFPCFDEPAFKIPWTVEITSPSDLVTLGNMPLATQSERDGMTTHVFETSPPMPSYLVALAVGPFDATKVDGASVPMTLYSPAGTASQTEALADQFPKHLDYLQTWFGSPLPYPKLDAVVVPDFAYGGMENVGLVVLNDGLLVDPEATNPWQEARVAEVVGHEIAHMWFGNFVTLEWWDDFWLNESFASWMGLKSRAAVLKGQPGQYARVRRTYRAIARDGRGSMRPIRTPIDPANVFESANFLAYAKGQALLGAVELWMGPERFRMGVQAYMKTHAFDNARLSDLMQALNAQSDDDIAAMLTPYLDEPGAPLLTFSRTETGFSVQQERYTSLGSEVADVPDWQVPIRYRTSKGEGRYLLTASKGEFEVEDTGFFLPVEDGVGYFAWTFEDPRELEALVANAKDLTPPEQIALLSNLDVLAGSGKLPVDRHLQLVASMAESTTLPALEEIVDAIASVESLVPPELDAAYSRYGSEVLGPLLDRVGLEAQSDEDAYARVVRADLIRWLGEFGSNAAVDQLQAAQVDAFLADPGGANLEVASVALRAHAEDQDLRFQAQMLERALETKNPQLKNVYLRAYANVDDPNARDRAMLWAMEEERSLDELMLVVRTLFDDDDLYGDIALDWAIDNHEAISAKMPPQFRARLIGMGAGCSPERFQRAKEFYLDPSRIVPGAERVAKEMGERVDACVTRRKAFGADLARLLEP